MARPRVLMNCAVSVDGKLNPSPHLRHGDFAMSRHAEDGRRMRELRARVDAVVVGASNVRADDPDLALASDEHARRRAHGEREPLRVVVTRGADGVLATCKLFDPELGGESVVAHAASLSAVAREQLGAVATLVQLGEDSVDVLALLRWLASTRGVSTVLCEGGGGVNAAFFAARAVDEVYLTLCPRVLGGATAPTFVSGPGFSPEAMPDAVLASVERLGDELFLRYDFRW
jgi:5-amino-6-(5-phosphoribosylamino)uracil reductase